MGMMIPYPFFFYFIFLYLFLFFFVFLSHCILHLLTSFFFCFLLFFLYLFLSLSLPFLFSLSFYLTASFVFSPLSFSFFFIMYRVLIHWQELNNPVLQYSNWSIKDDFVQYNPADNLFYVFFSAFYQDNGQIRSHGMLLLFIFPYV